MARHTFATTITLSNGVPIESVSKMLGHTKITTTQIYAKVIESKVSDDMNKLRGVLNNKKNKIIRSKSVTGIDVQEGRQNASENIIYNI